MPIAKDIATVFETIAPKESGIPGDELGFVYGDPATEVTGVACMWNVHARSIEAAVQAGANMLICHESIWLRPQTSPWYDGPTEDEIISNKLRKQLLDEHKLVVYRSHSNWDALPDDGVGDQAVAALGMTGLETVARQKYFSVQRLPQPMRVSALKQHVATGLGFDQCRVFGNADKIVETFAFLIGGFGENQLHMPQAAYEMGAEAIIIGEMSEFIVMACLEMGLPVIESLHSASEIPAIKRQAQMLAERLDVPVTYVKSGVMGFKLNLVDNRNRGQVSFAI